MDERLEKIKNDFLKLRLDICELIDEEMKSKSSYVLQKNKIGNATITVLRNPKLREKLRTETLLRNLFKMINIK